MDQQDRMYAYVAKMLKWRCEAEQGNQYHNMDNTVRTLYTQLQVSFTCPWCLVYMDYRIPDDIVKGPIWVLQRYRVTASGVGKLFLLFSPWKVNFEPNPLDCAPFPIWRLKGCHKSFHKESSELGDTMQELYLIRFPRWLPVASPISRDSMGQFRVSHDHGRRTSRARRLLRWTRVSPCVQCSWPRFH